MRKPQAEQAGPGSVYVEDRARLAPEGSTQGIGNATACRIVARLLADSGMGRIKDLLQVPKR
jgi:hypothetical protein